MVGHRTSPEQTTDMAVHWLVCADVVADRDLVSERERQRQRENGVAYSYMGTTRHFLRCVI